MYKKLSYKVLLIILVVLILLYLIAELTGTRERTFKEIVIETDTASITMITILNPEKEDIVLVKENNEWFVIVDGKKLITDQVLINSMLEPLAGLRTEKVSATDASGWERYEVTDSAAIRVIAEDDGKIVQDVYVGKFSYQQAKADPNMSRMQQPQGKMISYLRTADDDVVYAVEGFLKMTYTKVHRDFRDKTICQLDDAEVKSITYNYPDNNTFILNRKDTEWFLNGQPVDSAKTTRYVKILCNQKGYEFVDDYNTEFNKPDYTMIIEGNNFSPVILNAYPSDTTYIITSTQNRDGKFNGYRSDEFKKIFVNSDHFNADDE